jgi:hypothetical protein
MGFMIRKAISYKSLFYLVLCLLLCGSDLIESGFKIYRSKHDIFTNLKCIDSDSEYSGSDLGPSYTTPDYFLFRITEFNPIQYNALVTRHKFHV